jgi:hypothetical protein
MRWTPEISLTGNFVNPALVDFIRAEAVPLSSNRIATELGEQIEQKLPERRNGGENSKRLSRGPSQTYDRSRGISVNALGSQLGGSVNDLLLGPQHRSSMMARHV